MSTLADPDKPKTYIAECTEPNCESFGIGHENLEVERDDPGYLHYAARWGDLYGKEGYRVEVGRDPKDGAGWDVFINIAGDMWTPEETTALAAVLNEAAKKCARLNNNAHAEYYSRIVYDRLHAAAERAGLADDPLFAKGPRAITINVLAEMAEKCGVNVEDLFPRKDEILPHP